MKPSQRAIEAGQAVYSSRTLSLYDLFVLGICNRLVWRCPTPEQREHYQRWLSGNHLDVGVGTGYYPDRCRFPVARPRLGLMDLNDSVLQYAGRRLRRYKPEIIQHDVFQPVEAGLDGFDSVAVNYLFHCLPGTMAEKGIVLDNLRGLMNPGARLFGTTILGRGVERNAPARRLMALYNRKGIFANNGDDRTGLERELHARFDNVQTTIVGCVALFSARATPDPHIS